MNIISSYLFVLQISRAALSSFHVLIVSVVPASKPRSAAIASSPLLLASTSRTFLSAVLLPFPSEGSICTTLDEGLGVREPNMDPTSYQSQYVFYCLLPK